jgi:hypothetical protein
MCAVHDFGEKEHEAGAGQHFLSCCALRMIVQQSARSVYGIRMYPKDNLQG